MAKGRSLHIGLNNLDPNHYGGWLGSLNACENDASDMEAIANSCGFQTDMLLTQEATKHEVLAKILAVAKELNSGDIFMLSYAGHGGQIPDINQDESDETDETWCLYEGQLLDDELSRAWTAFAKGVRILVVSDSCHSGTVTRDRVKTLSQSSVEQALVSRGQAASNRKLQFRAMPKSVALKTYEANREFYNRRRQTRSGSASGKIAASVILIAGCQDNQLASDGWRNGLFTSCLLQVWDQGQFLGNYKSFCSRIAMLMPSSQTPNYYLTGQPNSSFEAQEPFTI